ncbi:hypothetical protein LR48_Vigan317s001300 [Vigna angularis]|uniref:Uncharacterized protein n=1 Tax=Phaseolus angularis TaxID=3914 RepID=A0A0L9T896_PHAAN|nr:hypothetical protein LR48_Vigan317s001300 [Vigna angularis]
MVRDGRRIQLILVVEVINQISFSEWTIAARSNRSCAWSTQRNGLKNDVDGRRKQKMRKPLSRGVWWLEIKVDVRENETNIGLVMRIDEAVMEKNGMREEIWVLKCDADGVEEC